MLELILMRHGKSDWDASYGADHDRPLADRGIRSAELMGRLLSAIAQVPELVVSSTAKRAHDTAILASRAGTWRCQLATDHGLYGGSPASVLEAVKRHGGSAQRVMIVGHEPTWSTLITELVGARVEMKTASVAGVGLMIDEWDSIVEARGWLAFLLHPRMFFGTVWEHPT